MTPPPLTACPICDASARALEHMQGGSLLCDRCGFFFRLDDQGELVEWATTSKSHPRGIYARAVASVVVLLAIAGCTMRPPAPPPATAPPAFEEAPPVIVLEETLPETVRICVTLRPIRTVAHPYACITLRDLRLQLRGRRYTALE